MDYVGPVLGVTLFALVPAAYIGLLIDWILGMAYALQGQARRTPLVGPFASWEISLRQNTGVDWSKISAVHLDFHGFYQNL